MEHKAKQRPFKVYVCPQYDYYPCQGAKDEHARGLIGWHDSWRCLDCRHQFVGYEMLGENGHTQGRVKGGRPELVAYLKHMAHSEYFGFLAQHHKTRVVWKRGNRVSFYAQ